MEANALHCKEVKNRYTSMERYVKVDNEDSERKAHDCKEQVNIDRRFDAHRNKFIDTTTIFESIWDGQQGCITFAKHGIELTSNEMRSVHCATYRAGPRTRKSEKTQIDRMLKVEIIKPAKAESATPILSAQN